jgi:uncharacterized membrane protein
MKTAVASLSLLLAACSAPQAPAEPAQPVPTPAPTAEASPAASQAPPMAKRAAGQEDAEPLQIFRAFGTEPFWNVNVEGTTLTFTTPEDQAGMSMQGTRRPIDGGVEVAGEHAGKPFVLRVTAGECSDGMSDNVYTLKATFRHHGVDYTGCGEAAK